MVETENQIDRELEDELLTGMVDFNRRIRWYLYLPVLVIGTFFSPLGIVAWLDVPWGNSIYSKSIVPLTVGAYVLWWWARKPRWIVLKLSGLLLTLLGFLSAAWVIYTAVWGNIWLDLMWFQKPIVVILGILYFIAVPANIVTAGMHSLYTARILRRFSPTELPAAIAAARERVERRPEVIEDEDW